MYDEEASREQRRKRGKGRIAAIVLLVFVVILLAAGAGFGVYAWRFQKGAGDIVVGEVDLSRVPDGEYEGGFKYFHVDVSAMVTVRDNRITAIELTDRGAERKRAQFELLIERVMKEQRLGVDTVAGATVSQKVLLKAVEDALSR